MHNGDDVNEIILARIKNCIGEHMNKHTSNIPIEKPPPLGCATSSIDRRIYGINETNHQSLLAVSVIIGCCLKLKESFRVKLVFHFVYF
jgi:hypothetical protein